MLSKEELEFQQRKVNARLTNKQKKRLQTLKLRKEKKLKRADLYEELQKNQLTKKQMEILRSSATIGQGNSTKQKLKLELKMQKLGLELPKDSDLYQEVQLPEFDFFYLFLKFFY